MLSVSLTLPNHKGIKEIIGFDKDLILFDPDEDHYCVNLSKNITATRIDNKNINYKLPDIAGRNDLFIYHHGNLIFHHTTNNKMVIELVFIPQVINGNVPPEAKILDESYLSIIRDQLPNMDNQDVQ